jgi:hypothetical protein
MALADLAKLGVRKLVVDVDDPAHAVIVRRLLLKFLVKQGLKATEQNSLSDPDAKGGWISVRHDVHGTLHFRPRALVVTMSGAELEFDLEDDTVKAKVDAAKAGATAAAGGMLMLFTGGFFGRGLVVRGGINAAKSAVRMTEAQEFGGAGHGQSTRVDVDVAQIPVLRDLLSRHGERIALLCDMKGADLILSAKELSSADLKLVVDGLKDQAKALLNS